MSESRLPVLFRNRLRVPVIGAPMFLVSFPPLVLAMCKAGIAGCFPHVNARSSEILDQWLSEMAADLAAFARANPNLPVGPIGVNLVVHRTNPRFAVDLDLVVEHQVPLVLTSLGHPGPVVEAVHAYGGVVLCDVTNATHARKAAASGVDGMICVGAGAVWTASPAFPVSAKSQPLCIIPCAFQKGALFSSVKRISSSTKAFAVA